MIDKITEKLYEEYLTWGNFNRQLENHQDNKKRFRVVVEYIIKNNERIGLKNNLKFYANSMYSMYYQENYKIEPLYSSKNKIVLV